MNKLLTTMFALAVASVTAFTAPGASAQDVKGNPANAGKLIAMCIGCHGIQGYQATFPEVYKVPKIAGQNAKYITNALTAYRQGDRKHPTMRAIAASLSDQDIADVASYYESLGKDSTKPVPDQAKAASAEVAALVQKGACVSCHGANFTKPVDPSYPKLAGQNADYLFVALKAYKTENNPNVGRSNGVMAGVAKQFSNAELKSLAGYIGSLDGEVKTVSQSEIHHR